VKKTCLDIHIWNWRLTDARHLMAINSPYNYPSSGP
jgi:hypothetical protein